MRRLFVPEVIQASAMDCGPASLKTLLEGFGIEASYGRLREACFTSVDGTSIDQIEDAALRLGLDAEQTMLPVDHLLLDETRALPALVVVRLPMGVTHFVVLWRRCGRWVQVMDPGTGRIWRSRSDVLNDLYIHSQLVSSSEWREWASSPDFLEALEARMRVLGLGAKDRRGLIAEALADVSPGTLSSLDAAARFVESLASEGAVPRGRALGQFIGGVMKRPDTIPESWWSARVDPADPTRLRIRGAVLLRVKGIRKPDQIRPALVPEFAAALSERPSSSIAVLCSTLRDGRRFLAALLGALSLAAAAVVAEAVLFRGLFDLPRMLAPGSQRWYAAAALGAFFAAVALLESGVTSAVCESGRKFEGRLRLEFLRKIPRLADAYFRSRLMSDMAERAHSAHRLRDLPSLAAAMARAIFGLVFTVAGIVYLYPESSALALAAAAVAVAVPLLAHPWLTEKDMRARTHGGALGRFFLDALLGLTAVRAHGTGGAIAREHEHLLAEWAGTALKSGRAAVVAQSVQAALCTAIVAWLLMERVRSGAESGGMLLLVYWSLSIPQLGQEVATLAAQYPRLRNTLLRFMEPLGTPEEDATEPETVRSEPAVGAAIHMINVTVAATGHTILENINVQIEPGEHIAVIGSSGAGKSTLTGLLLGWNKPAAGELLVDGEKVDGARLARLRRSTAWVSPEVQLWNQPLFENLRYGIDEPVAAIGAVLDDAELRTVVEKLPRGMQTLLGESGRLLSGGEGQRVRFGRGLCRGAVRLAILDEAFRGLERGRRRMLLEHARRRWKHATLLNITHDVAETLSFPRVLVMDGGHIVEDGSPEELYRKPGSRYRDLLEAEEAAQDDVWSDPEWRLLAMQDGRLREETLASRSKEAVC